MALVVGVRIGAVTSDEVRAAWRNVLRRVSARAGGVRRGRMPVLTAPRVVSGAGSDSAAPECAMLLQGVASAGVSLAPSTFGGRSAWAARARCHPSSHVSVSGRRSGLLTAVHLVSGPRCLGSRRSRRRRGPRPSGRAWSPPPRTPRRAAAEAGRGARRLASARQKRCAAQHPCGYRAQRVPQWAAGRGRRRRQRRVSGGGRRRRPGRAPLPLRRLRLLRAARTLLHVCRGADAQPDAGHGSLGGCAPSAAPTTAAPSLVAGLCWGGLHNSSATLGTRLRRESGGRRWASPLGMKTPRQHAGGLPRPICVEAAACLALANVGWK
jgi:hypothetical protein